MGAMQWNNFGVRGLLGFRTCAASGLRDGKPSLTGSENEGTAKHVPQCYLVLGTTVYLQVCAGTSVLVLEGLGDSVKVNAKALSLSPETTLDIVV